MVSLELLGGLYSLSWLKKPQFLGAVYLGGFDQLALQVEVNWTWKPVRKADVDDEILRHWLRAKGKLAAAQHFRPHSVNGSFCSLQKYIINLQQILKITDEHRMIYFTPLVVQIELWAV